MRELSNHRVNECNLSLHIEVHDEPGQGNACHLYEIRWPDGTVHEEGCGSAGNSTTIRFQNGPIKEVGINGVTNEALLAIIEDRLIGFQSGPYVCRENAVALTKIQEAMMWLQKRTRDRLARNVEGTHKVS